MSAASTLALRTIFSDFPNGKGVPVLTARSTPPFRADHVGSLLRPANLHEERASFAAGKISAAELAAVEVASTVEGNALTIDEERAKLALVVETAEEIWGR